MTYNGIDKNLAEHNMGFSNHLARRPGLLGGSQCQAARAIAGFGLRRWLSPTCTDCSFSSIRL